MQIDVVTLFPEALVGCLGFGVTGRALERGVARVATWDPRRWTDDERGTVDDRPFGGGPGMVMMAEPLARCLEAVVAAGPKAPVNYLSPQGRRLRQADMVAMSREPRLILLCGRYEGIDQRLIDQYVDQEWSIGDFVISGGELAAALVIDAVVRLLPGALGKSESAEQDSFMDGLLDCPHYTRPEHWRGCEVPQVLRSGDHGAVARWRRREALGATWLKRPDLLATAPLGDLDRELLQEFMDQYQQREGANKQ